MEISKNVKVMEIGNIPLKIKEDSLAQHKM